MVLMYNLNNTKLSDYNVELSDNWIKSNNIYMKEINSRFSIVTDSFYGLIDIIPSNLIQLHNDDKYIKIRDRYFNRGAFDGINKLEKLFEQSILDKKKIVVFSICPTL